MLRRGLPGGCTAVSFRWFLIQPPSTMRCIQRHAAVLSSLHSRCALSVAAYCDDTVCLCDALLHLHHPPLQVQHLTQRVLDHSLHLVHVLQLCIHPLRSLHQLMGPLTAELSVRHRSLHRRRQQRQIRRRQLGVLAAACVHRQYQSTQLSREKGALLLHVRQRWRGGGLSRVGSEGGVGRRRGGRCEGERSSGAEVGSGGRRRSQQCRGRRRLRRHRFYPTAR